jgi:GDP-6-deoxy-D-talose 4-dehydrogenase
MRVLITGLTGFTGQYMAEELKSHGHEVVGLTANLLDREALYDEIASIRPEAVVHLAAISFVQHEDVNTIYRVNVEGTYNLLCALHQAKLSLKSVLLASSAAVYGNASSGALNEQSPFNPMNDYAVSKVAMEHMARLWFNRLPIFIVRPFNYTGIGQAEHFVIPKIVAHFKRKAAVIELGNLEVWREFNDVREVVAIYRQLLEQAPLHQTLNICTGKTYSLKEVIAQCQKLAHHEIDVKINPAFVRQNEVTLLKGDPALLHQYISEKNDYPLEQTLRWMCGV